MAKESLEEEIRRVEAEQARLSAFQPIIVQTWFDQANNLIMLTLNNGVTMCIPPYLGQEFSQFDEATLAQVAVGPGGDSLIWASQGSGIEIESILAGRFGSRKWMEKLRSEKGIPLGLWPDSHEARRAWGKQGGSIPSEARAHAARENGKKGGRPLKAMVGKMEYGSSNTGRLKLQQTEDGYVVKQDHMIAARKTTSKKKQGRKPLPNQTPTQNEVESS